MKLEERKIKHYIQFIKTLSDCMNNLESDDVVIAHNHAYNNLMLVASSSVISAVTQYQKLVINHIKSCKESGYQKQHDRLLLQCFKEMRADLYGNK